MNELCDSKTDTEIEVTFADVYGDCSSKTYE